MSTGIRLKPKEVHAAFESDPARECWPPVMSVQQVAKLLGLSPKTLYEWMSKGRLDGAYRRRGKHALFWRDRVLDVVFNGPDWKH